MNAERALYATFVESLYGRRLCALRCSQQRDCWHNDRKHGHQVVAPLDATVDSNTAAASRFGLPDDAVEKFRHANTIQHFAHVFPRHKMSSDGTTTPGNCKSHCVRSTTIRHRAAISSNKELPKIYGQLFATEAGDGMTLFDIIIETAPYAMGFFLMCAGLMFGLVCK